MSWRTVVISSRCKLDYKMGFMVVRSEETKKIFLDEIAILLIENPAVSLTGCLIEALTEKKIRVIFCDAKRIPMSELVPYYSCYDTSRKIRTQIQWSDDIKGAVWADIVSEKIRKQADFLFELGRHTEEQLLRSYLSEIECYDASNREGHAAKVYFNALFGKDFTRSEENIINAALNYGYSIILSAFNREIVNQGYITQLGIFHDNMFNHFNLSCDLMEPFRILVDRKVKSMELQSLTSSEKHKHTLEKILDYMELVRTFDRDRLFIMVNMRTYFSNDEMDLFIRSACSHDFNVLLLESVSFPTLPNTKRYVIDEDLCEF